MDYVQQVATVLIRVGSKQEGKISRDRVAKHLRLLEQDEELYPIDLLAVGDGTFAIAGNGRHRYFAYLMAGYSSVPAVVHN